MTSQCGCQEARVKLEGLVATLKVMQASLNVLGEQIDHMLAVAQEEQARAMHAPAPHGGNEIASGVPDEPQKDMSEDGSDEAAACEANEFDDEIASDSDDVLAAPVVGFSIPEATASELNIEAGDLIDQDDASMIADEAALADVCEAYDASIDIEADVEIIKSLDDDAEEALIEDESAEVEIATVPVFTGFDTGLDLEDAAGDHSPREVHPIAKAMADAGQIQEPCSAEASEPAMETMSGAETTDVTADIEEADSEPVEAEFSDDDMPAEDVSKVVALTSTRRRVYRSVAASMLVALVVAGAVMATKVEALDGLTSLALANGLR